MRKLRQLREEQGSTLVELAFVLPVFFTLVLGFIYFAMALFQLANITYASRAAMRFACLHSMANAQPATIQNVTSIVGPMVFAYPANTSTTTLTYTGGNIVGGTATVVVTLNFQTGMRFQAAASGVIVQ